MKELSIFVDESGHFDMTSKNSPYYLVSFVFHDQSLDITDNLSKIDSYTCFSPQLYLPEFILSSRSLRRWFRLIYAIVSASCTRPIINTSMILFFLRSGQDSNLRLAETDESRLMKKSFRWL